MREYFTWVLLSVCLSFQVHAQVQPPELLRDAAQCLVSTQMLAARRLSLGYLVDTQSWPGERVLYVVNYTGSSRSKGFVFTIFVTTVGGRSLFNIQNNARFAPLRGGIDRTGLDFTDPSLGGTWTQEHLVKAIKQIEQSPRFEMSAAGTLTPSSLIQCQSYADRK
jgi:hypothetical protein